MRFKVCKSFTVESGHMLSKHPGSCRYPHGHTRTIDVVVSSSELDSNDMVLDFKALKAAVVAHIERYDHAMAINSSDKLLPHIQSLYPECLVIYNDCDPTSEMIAKDLFEIIEFVLQEDLESVTLESVRVSETPSTWAEVSRD